MSHSKIVNSAPAPALPVRGFHARQRPTWPSICFRTWICPRSTAGIVAAVGRCWCPARSNFPGARLFRHYCWAEAAMPAQISRFSQSCAPSGVGLRPPPSGNPRCLACGNRACRLRAWKAQMPGIFAVSAGAGIGKTENVPTVFLPQRSGQAHPHKRRHLDRTVCEPATTVGIAVPETRHPAAAGCRQVPRGTWRQRRSGITT